ncbi:MAG: hypothetical protein MRERV_78c004 [Mycoplasmataceae bacterium RV_VA103A]|nr:MAG: hypothetical protein MRERV_78c004 [Mycoplasmataceae bacterium RV_VA103A]
MNKKRFDFIYELAGRVKGKKQRTDKNGQKFWQLLVDIDNKERVKYINVFPNNLSKESIWKDIQEANYFKKEYVFFCKNYMGIYKLVDWKELTPSGAKVKNHGSIK